MFLVDVTEDCSKVIVHVMQCNLGHRTLCILPKNGLCSNEVPGFPNAWLKGHIHNLRYVVFHVYNMILMLTHQFVI